MQRNLAPYLIFLPVLGIIVLVLLANTGNKPNQATNATETTIINSETKKDTNMQETTSSENKMVGQPMTIDKTKSYTAIMKTTEGTIKIKLNAAQTPITVNNFVGLAKKNFYDNTIFHRVIKGFMIQGGDPNGNGSGGPGYSFADEPFTGEYTRGTVAMANAGPNTNGSQFFIMHKDNPLPKNYVIFGQVIEGIEVVDKIAETPVDNPGSQSPKPLTPIKILSVQIEEK